MKLSFLFINSLLLLSILTTTFLSDAAPTNGDNNGENEGGNGQNEFVAGNNDSATKKNVTLREEKLKARLAMWKEDQQKRTDRKPSAKQMSPEEDAQKQKADRAKVRALLAQYRQKIAPRLAELVKQQREDPVLQKRLKEIADARAMYPNEEHNERLKELERQSSSLDDAYEFDIDLSVEQAQAMLDRVLGTIKDVVIDVANTSLGAVVGPSGAVRNLSSLVIGSLQQQQQKQRRKRGAALDATTAPNELWPYAVVPYSFDATISDNMRSLIQKAIDFWAWNTCIAFNEDETAFNRLHFTSAFPEQGCRSAVGRQANSEFQYVWLKAGGCESFATAAHEIGHALGFWHEQSRYDRNDWVTYYAANVQTGKTGNFAQIDPEWNNNYAVAYDYGSVMHYSANAFSSNDQPTLVATQGTKWQRTMGQRFQPAFYDLKVMNKHYQCEANWCTDPAVTVTCLNGGIVDTWYCDSCLCPPGFGGNLCEEILPNPEGYAPSGVPNQCGTGNKKLKAASTGLSTEFTGQVGTTDVELQDANDDWDFAYCHWYIYADPGYGLAVKIVELGDACSSACGNGNTEVRMLEDSADWGKTGVRLCCPSDLGTAGYLTLTSSKGQAMVSLYAKYNQQRFRIRYWQYSVSG